MRPAKPVRTLSLTAVAVGLLAASVAPGESHAGPRQTASAPPWAAMAPPDQSDAIVLMRAPAGAPEEQWEVDAHGERSVRNVLGASLTPFLPAPGTETGTAVIVAPGGGFYQLGFDGEGVQVARLLAARGVVAFVLKYRTIPGPRDHEAFRVTVRAMLQQVATGAGPPLETPPEALADAQAAVRLVRSRSAEWGIDPRRVGMVGFSAGAILTLSVAQSEAAADRPDFIAPIYPDLRRRAVRADAPPMFLAIALDDPLFASGRPLDLIAAWQEARRPIEAHLYERGGHGFGLRQQFRTSDLWPEAFLLWLRDRGLLTPTPAASVDADPAPRP